MKQKAMVLFLAVLLLGAFVVGKELGEYASASGEAKGKKGNNIIVVDAGHGGSDPGKVGINGELEKDLNLEIAKKVEKELKDLGFQGIREKGGFADKSGYHQQLQGSPCRQYPSK